MILWLKPNSSAPQGSQWYYHVDRATQRKLVHQRAKLTDDLQHSVLLTASDDTPRHLFRNDDELYESQQRRDREPDVADEIRTREHTLEQLKWISTDCCDHQRWRNANICLGPHQLTKPTMSSGSEGSSRFGAGG